MARALVTLAVLAGGASHRMGRDKPGIVVAGRTMLDHVLAAAGALPTLVVGRSHPTSAWVMDPEPRGGPLAGLVAALETAPGPVVLVGADQPWLRSDTVHRLSVTPGSLPAVPEHSGHRQVLCGRYPQEVLEAARTVVSRGGGLQALLDLGCDLIGPVRWRRWEEDGRSWFSVNTPGDLDTGLSRYGPTP